MNANKKTFLQGLPLAFLGFYFYNKNQNIIGLIFSILAGIVLVTSLFLIIKDWINR